MLLYIGKAIHSDKCMELPIDDDDVKRATVQTKYITTPHFDQY